MVPRSHRQALWLAFAILPAATLFGHSEPPVQQTPETASDPATQAAAILDRSLVARGGKAAIQGIQKRMISGRIQLTKEHLTGDFTIKQAAPSLMTTTMTIQGLGEIKAGFDGETAWEMSDQNSARVLAGPDLLSTRRSGSLLGEHDWRAIYVDARADGEATIAGVVCDRVLLTQPLADEPVAAYFDRSTGLPAAIECPARAGPNQSDSVADSTTWTYWSDYREHAGVMHAMTVRIVARGIDQVLTVDAVRINDEVPEKAIAQSTFDLPKEIAALRPPTPAPAEPVSAD